MRDRCSTARPTLEVGPFTIEARKRGAAQDGVFPLRVLQLRPVKRGAVAVCVGEVGTRQVGTLRTGARKLHASQLGVGKVGIL